MVWWEKTQINSQVNSEDVYTTYIVLSAQSNVKAKFLVWNRTPGIQIRETLSRVAERFKKKGYDVTVDGDKIIIEDVIRESKLKVKIVSDDTAMGIAYASFHGPFEKLLDMLQILNAQIAPVGFEDEHGLAWSIRSFKSTNAWYATIMLHLISYQHVDKRLHEARW